jgi:glutathione S-transferase
MMTLYEFPPTRSIRVRWTLQELGLQFRAVTVNLLAGQHRSPEFLAINPGGKIPVLVDGDLVLTESVAIALYLAEKYPEKGFMSVEARGRAEVYRWSLFAATELEQPLWRMVRNTRLYPAPERQPADVAIAAREFRAMAAVLEQHMQGREFVAGAAVSVADFVLAYTLDWANESELLSECPVLRAYMQRMYARPRAAMRIADAFKSITPQQGAA